MFLSFSPPRWTCRAFKTSSINNLNTSFLPNSQKRVPTISEIKLWRRVTADFNILKIYCFAFVFRFSRWEFFNVKSTAERKRRTKSLRKILDYVHKFSGIFWCGFFRIFRLALKTSENLIATQSQMRETRFGKTNSTTFLSFRRFFPFIKTTSNNQINRKSWFVTSPPYCKT